MYLTEASRPVCGSAGRRDPLWDVSAPHLPADSGVLQEKLFFLGLPKKPDLFWF